MDPTDYMMEAIVLLIVTLCLVITLCTILKSRPPRNRHRHHRPQQSTLEYIKSCIAGLFGGNSSSNVPASRNPLTISLGYQLCKDQGYLQDKKKAREVYKALNSDSKSSIWLRVCNYNYHACMWLAILNVNH